MSHAEIEHQPGMTDESLLRGESLQFRHQPRLADTCFATHVERAPRDARGAAFQDGSELRQLGASPYERARRLCGVGLCRSDQAPDLERGLDAFHAYIVDSHAARDPLRALMHFGIEHGFPCAGDLKKPRREIHRLADDGVRAVTRAPQPARHHLARCDADVHRERPAHLGLERRHRGMNLKRSPDRALRLVAVRDRRAEHCHHRVADVLVDCPAAAFDDVVYGLEVTPEHSMYFLGIERLRQTGEAAEIREEHRDRAALSFAALRSNSRVRRRPAAKRRSTAAAELFPAIVAESARGAVHRQCAAALRAVPSLRPVRGPATGALDRG